MTKPQLKGELPVFLIHTSLLMHGERRESIPHKVEHAELNNSILEAIQAGIGVEGVARSVVDIQIFDISTREPTQAK